ncbi:sulfur carrier protein [Motilibacter rhizosphaerae]|uniref:Sulfur carrier protein n=1 Tax=Motilibacter rhizosphaerae TaxID=598652 RepID=A0A4Q7NWC2_9ACTN|nr:sulfur carrier protein ThiS [Motilibacter rhizosphaerae]RZS91474.1 sulfur carrier protein [Motilibacter rhizosphaerae]
MSVQVRVNDEQTVLRAGATVAALVAERFGDSRWIAVAVDGEVVPRRAWAGHVLHDGAAVEVLTAVQGG